MIQCGEVIGTLCYPWKKMEKRRSTTGFGSSDGDLESPLLETGLRCLLRLNHDKVFVADELIVGE